MHNGHKFDSTRDAGISFNFRLGTGRVIPGFEEGVASMAVGGLRQILVPPALGYGSSRAQGGLVPPNSTLVFEVELLTGVEATTPPG